MIRWDGTVFDATIAVDTPVYTGVQYVDHLADGDQLGVHVIVDRATNALTVTVVQEHSGDGVNWTEKTTGVNFTTTIASGTTQGYSGETYPTRPSLDFVRLRISIRPSALPVSAHVVIHAVVRDRSDDPLPCECAPLLPGEDARSAEDLSLLERRRPHAALAEVVRHLESMPELQPERALELAISRLSPHAHVDLERFARRLQRSTPEAREAFLATVREQALEAADAEEMLQVLVPPAVADGVTGQR